MTWLEQVPARESKWITAGEDFHFASQDYPELTDILNAPRPQVVTEGNEWGRTAAAEPGIPSFLSSKTAAGFDNPWNDPASNPHLTDPGFGQIYGDASTPSYYSPDGPVWMYRKGQHVRFYTDAGTQVGPEQDNIAPAVAYALTQGWKTGDAGFDALSPYAGARKVADISGTNNDKFWGAAGYGQTDAERERNGIGLSEHTDLLCPGSGKVDDNGSRCPYCDQVTDGWHTKDGFVRKWHSDPAGKKTAATRKTATRHLTLTGPYAGQPICGARPEPGDNNVHAAYAPEEMLTSPDTCAACRAVWASGDPDADPTTAPDSNQQSLFATRKKATEMTDKVFGKDGYPPSEGDTIVMNDGHVWQVTHVNDHTVGLASDDGWTTSLQRPWFDRNRVPLPGAPQDQHDIYKRINSGD
jgi:hypothetical protein